MLPWGHLPGSFAGSIRSGSWSSSTGASEGSAASNALFQTGVPFISKWQPPGLPPYPHANRHNDGGMGGSPKVRPPSVLGRPDAPGRATRLIEQGCSPQQRTPPAHSMPTHKSTLYNMKGIFRKGGPHSRPRRALRVTRSALPCAY